MSNKKSWLDALKETVQNEPKPPCEDSGNTKPTSVQNMQKPREAFRCDVVDIRTVPLVQRDPDEQRLLAAGWTPNDGCGPLNLTIWESPETGFYCSREVALHRLDQHNGVRGES